MKRGFSSALAVLLLAALSIGLLRWGGIVDKGGSGLALEQPSLLALAATDGQGQQGVNFLQQEAGISAYVKLDQAIDLAQVRGAFKTIETVSDEYIIGEVALPDLLEEAHPHVYVNKDGWIVAYYSKDEPASKIIQWIGYNGGPITTTTLEDAIRKIHDLLQLPYPKGIKYYYFGHPNANRIMLIVEVNHKDGTDSFYLTIPSGIQWFEAYWMFYQAEDDRGTIGIDDTQVGEIAWKREFLYGNLTSRLKRDVKHTIWVWHYCSGYCDFTGGAVVLIYQV